MYTLYFTILLFAILAFILCKNGNVKKNRTYLIVCFSIMLLLHTFFNPEYFDNYWYKMGFYEYKSMSLVSVIKENAPSLKAETGYRILCKIITFITSDWRFAMFIIGAIMLSGYYLTSKLYSNMVWLSVLIIMVDPFLQSLFVLRQHLAMGIILLSYYFVINRRIIPYLLICFLAISIHQSAAVFLPIYFIYNLQLNIKIHLLFIIIAIILYNNFAYFLTTGASFAMATASYDEHFFEYDLQQGTNSKMAILLSVLLLLRIFLLKGDFYKEGINKLLSIILILGTTISIIGTGFVGTSRLNMYYSSASFLLIPNTLEYVRHKNVRTLYGILYFLFLLYFFVKNIETQDLKEFWFF